MGPAYKSSNRVEVLRDEKWLPGKVSACPLKYNPQTDIVNQAYMVHIDGTPLRLKWGERRPCFWSDQIHPLVGRRRLANRRYRDSPVLLRLLEEIREANRRHQARQP